MSDPFLAEIIMFAGNFAPRGWAKCDGTLLPIASYSAVFSLMGTMYGGDGRTTFALPDMRGRVPIHPGQGPGLSNYVQGPGGGAQNVTLTVNNLPAHSHSGTIKAKNGQPDETNPGGGYPSTLNNSTEGYADASNTTMAADAIQTVNTGNGQSFSIVQPYCAVQFIVALQGIFPSRN